MESCEKNYVKVVRMRSAQPHKWFQKIASRYRKFVAKLNALVDQESSWFKGYQYLTNVHVSALTSIVILTNVCVNPKMRSSFHMKLFLYVTDLLHASRIFFGFTLEYVSPDTGIAQTDPKKIAVRYLKSQFLFDVFCYVPFEVFADVAWVKSYLKIFTLNRAFRYLYMIVYYRQCSYKLAISKHLRWTFLIYRTLFQVQLMTNVW